MRVAHARYRGVMNARMVDGSRLGAARRALALVAETTTISYRKGRRSYTSPNLGEIFLCWKKLGGGLVAHEATHAARYYLVRRGVDLSAQSTDERMARVVGKIVAQIGERVWKEGGL